MELEEFVRRAIGDAVRGIEKASSELGRGVRLASAGDRRAMEFDIAVTVEEKTSAQGKAGVRILSVVEAGGDIGKSNKQLTSHRIAFGVDVNSMTNAERDNRMSRANRLNREAVENDTI